ncbi:MAG: polymer-forming cytoskeletal protein [Hyphomicrobiaceae bacterium]
MAFSLNSSRNAGPKEDQRPFGTPPQQPMSAQTGFNTARGAAPDEGASSIIGHDLELRGTDIKIIVRGRLRVDGRIAGEVYGKEITIGPDAQVSGKIVAERVLIHGMVSSGEIHSNEVALLSGSHVEADIHHRRLAIEEGAMFDGRSRRTPENVGLPTPDSTD